MICFLFVFRRFHTKCRLIFNWIWNWFLFSCPSNATIHGRQQMQNAIQLEVLHVNLFNQDKIVILILFWLWYRKAVISRYGTLSHCCCCFHFTKQTLWCFHQVHWIKSGLCFEKSSQSIFFLNKDSVWLDWPSYLASHLNHLPVGNLARILS